MRNSWETPLAERHNLVFAGTLVVRGQGTALVVATGMQSIIGRIARLTHEVQFPRTPLQVVMGRLSRVLVSVALGVSLIVPGLAWVLAKLPPQQAVLTGLSLAFATIPEELPVIISLVLALGAYRLSRRQAIVKRLPAIEALGTVTVIATDKTGTLTQNQLRVERVEPEEQRTRLLEAGVLGTAASDEGSAALFDPLEVALLQAARARSTCRPCVAPLPFTRGFLSVGLHTHLFCSCPSIGHAASIAPTSANNPLTTCTSVSTPRSAHWEETERLDRSARRNPHARRHARG